MRGIGREDEYGPGRDRMIVRRAAGVPNSNAAGAPDAEEDVVDGAVLVRRDALPRPQPEYRGLGLRRFKQHGAGDPLALHLDDRAALFQLRHRLGDVEQACRLRYFAPSSPVAVRPSRTREPRLSPSQVKLHDYLVFQRERSARVLLDDEHAHAGAADLDDLLQHELDVGAIHTRS